MKKKINLPSFPRALNIYSFVHSFVRSYYALECSVATTLFLQFPIATKVFQFCLTELPYFVFRISTSASAVRRHIVVFGLPLFLYGP